MSNEVNSKIIDNILEILEDIKTVERNYKISYLQLAQQEENIHILFDKKSSAPLFRLLERAKRMYDDNEKKIKLFDMELSKQNETSKLSKNAR